MKKLILCLILCLCLLSTTALADYSLGTEDDTLTLLGKGEPDEIVAVLLLNSDTFECEDAQSTWEKYEENIDNDVAMTTDEIFYHGIAYADENGEWSITIPMTDIDTIDLTYVSSTGEMSYIKYASVSFRTNMIPDLKGKAQITDDEYKSLADTMTKYIDFITDSAVMYKSLKDKTVVAEFCAPVILSLSEDSESLTTLKTVLNKAIHIEAISEGKITDFEEVMYFDYDKDILDTITNEGKDKAIELVQGKKYVSEKAFIDEATFQLALQNFNYNVNKSGDSLLDTLLASNDILGLDLSELKDLSNSNKPKAAKKLAEKKSETLKEAQDYLDDIVEDYEEKSSSGGSGGGGGSVSGSIPYTGSIETSISNQFIQEQKYIYSDMSLSPWAADAIVYLADKKIVNGYADGTFKPTAPITRAEFTKLVVEAFYGISAYEFENQFIDVEDNAWYAPYINKAYSEGLVSGSGNGQFRPNDTITRQDMAVIIYNASVKHNLITKVEGYTVFGDDAAISDYAKDAVYTLKDNNIINGVGDSTFSPLTNADRASACQILYNLMTKFSK